MEHYGVYGVWLQKGLVVAIRKARGPYTGMLDLPGGSPELGETAIDTLARELHEECGVTSVHVTSWHAFDFHLNRSSSLIQLNTPVRNSLPRSRMLSPFSPLRPTGKDTEASIKGCIDD